jgi:hypothetical protein
VSSELWRTFARKIQSTEFIPTTADPVVYIQGRNSQPTTIFTHVDGGACFAPPGHCQQYTQEVRKLFPGRDQGKLESVLGMALTHNPHMGASAICQEKLILDTINNLGTVAEVNIELQCNMYCFSLFLRF